MAGKKGSVLNKILNMIGLVDDEETADSYDDGYDSEEPERPHTSIPRRDKHNTQDRQQETRQQDSRRRGFDYGSARNTGSSYDNGRTESRGQSSRRNTSGSSNTRETGKYDYTSRTSRFDDSKPREEPKQESRERRRPTQQRAVMYVIRSVEDCCDAIDSLILNNTVLLNMEGLDTVNRQRSVDTMCGAVFALHATIKKASEGTYLVAPRNVEVDEVSGDGRRS